MQRFKIEYDRFKQMQSDLELALHFAKNGQNDNAITYLEFCLNMMQTEENFYGKDMPVDTFREDIQQALTA